ncbi:MAG: hypothetical protein ABFE02_06965 [Sulfuricella sp.]
MKRISSAAVHRMHALYAVLALGLSVLGLYGCDANQAGNWFGTKSPYPVKSSGLLFGGNISFSPIYWLDNDRVLLPGYSRKHPQSTDGTDPATKGFGVYIWNTSNNTYVRHADFNTPRWFLCFNKGFIAYSIGSQGEEDRGSKYILKAGMLGHEKRLPTEIFWKFHPELKQCHEPKAEVRPEHRGGGIDFLRAEDGYLYAGAATASEGHYTINAQNQNEPVKFYQPGRAEPISLPILPKETFQVETFSEYGRKYLIIPSRPKSRDFSSSDESWPPGTPKPIYLLSRDGTVETIEVPAGPWVTMDAAYITAKGIFIVSNNAVGANSSNAGGWLLHDGKITKLFDQLVDGNNRGQTTV